MSGTKDESPENVSVCDICVETCVSRSSPPDKNDAVAYEDDDNFGLFSLVILCHFFKLVMVLFQAALDRNLMAKF